MLDVIARYERPSQDPRRVRLEAAVVPVHDGLGDREAALLVPLEAVFVFRPDVRV